MATYEPTDEAAPAEPSIKPLQFWRGAHRSRVGWPDELRADVVRIDVFNSDVRQVQFTDSVGKTYAASEVAFRRAYVPTPFRLTVVDRRVELLLADTWVTSMTGYDANSTRRTISALSEEAAKRILEERARSQSPAASIVDVVVSETSDPTVVYTTAMLVSAVCPDGTMKVIQTFETDEDMVFRSFKASIEAATFGKAPGADACRCGGPVLLLVPTDAPNPAIDRCWALGVSFDHLARVGDRRVGGWCATVQSVWSDVPMNLWPGGFDRSGMTPAAFGRLQAWWTKHAPSAGLKRFVRSVADAERAALGSPLRRWLREERSADMLHGSRDDLIDMVLTLPAEALLGPTYADKTPAWATPWKTARAPHVDRPAFRPVAAGDYGACPACGRLRPGGAECDVHAQVRAQLDEVDVTGRPA